MRERKLTQFVRRPRVLLPIILMLGALTYLPTITSTVHGATGTVCLIDTSSSSCPALPASLTGSLGSQLRVSVFLQGSDQINGFDVNVLADHTVLTPAGVDLTGSIISSPQIVVECIGGILRSGNTCSAVDSIDALHLAAVGPAGMLSTATTGLLFTAIYNVTGTTSIPVEFQTGCTGTSVPPSTCVTITNGTLVAIPEAVQTATFSISTTADFALAASPTSLTIPAGASGTSTLSIISINGFSGTIALSATAAPAGLPLSLSPTSVNLGSGQTLTSVLTIATTTSTPFGTYSVTVTGTSGSLSHVATITAVVPPPPPQDFTVTANPTSLTIQAGSSATSTITITSLNGFTGTVNLVSAINPSGPTTSLSTNSVTLSAGGTGTSILTVSTTTSTTAGTYAAQVTGTSSGLTHAAPVSVMVTGPAQPGEVCIIPSGASSCPSSLLSFSGTAGSQLRVSVFIQGSGALNGFSVTLLADHTIFQPTNADLTGTVLPGTPSIIVKCIGGVLVTGTTCSPNDTIDTIHFAVAAGLGTITLAPTTGLLFTAIYNVVSTTSGTIINFQTGCTNTSVNGGICVTITNGTPTPVPETVPGTAPPSFTISGPTSFTISRGSPGTSTITLTSLNGFTGTIQLSSSISPTGHHSPTVSLSSSSVSLAAGGTATVVLTVSADKHTALGTYTITVTATSGSTTQTTTVTVTVIR